MKNIILLSLILSTTSFAQIKTVSIHDQSVDITNAINYSGTDKLHSGEFTKPYTFMMADGNELEFDNAFWLSEAGRISLVGQMGMINYKLPDGSSMTLDCAKRFVNGNEMGRIISFHPNGRLKMGCDSLVQKWFETDHAKLNIRYKSFFELNDKGEIVYANRLSDDSYIKYQGQTVLLNGSSEAAFHKDGTPRFFTIKVGEVLKYKSKNIGTVTLYTDPARRTAVKFNEQGNLDVASIKEAVEVNFKGNSYSFQSLAAQFYPTGEVFSIFVPGNTNFQNNELGALAVPLRTGEFVICLDETKEVRSANYCLTKVQEFNNK